MNCTADTRRSWENVARVCLLHTWALPVNISGQLHFRTIF